MFPPHQPMTADAQRVEPPAVTSLKSPGSKSEKAGRKQRKHASPFKTVTADREIDNDFTLVKRRKKKAKICSETSRPPSSCPSPMSEGSTSSTNTSSMASNDPRRKVAQPLPQNYPANKEYTLPDATKQEISQQARRFAETRYAFPPPPPLHCQVQSRGRRKFDCRRHPQTLQELTRFRSRAGRASVERKTRTTSLRPKQKRIVRIVFRRPKVAFLAWFPQVRKSLP